MTVQSFTADLRIRLCGVSKSFTADLRIESGFDCVELAS
jgi:hypothetical protein